MKTKMYRFEAIQENGNYMIDGEKTIAHEARYVIIAESEQRAMEILEENGENPENFYLSEIGAAKNELGRYYPESIRDARI